MLHFINVLAITENGYNVAIGLNQSGSTHDIDIITQNSYGFGDIIRMIAYSSEIQKRTKKKILVKFVVEPDKTHLAKNIDIVLSHFHIDVDYIIEISLLEKYKHNYTNLLHVSNAKIVRNTLGTPRLKPKKPSITRNHIAVWNPYHFLKDIPYEKMPISQYDFNSAMSKLDNVKYVSYKMNPIEVFDIIRKAKFCIGYEGLGQVVAYNYGKKLITMSKWKDVSINTGGPDSIIVNNVNDLERVINDWNIL